MELINDKLNVHLTHNLNEQLYKELKSKLNNRLRFELNNPLIFHNWFSIQIESQLRNQMK